MSTPGYLVPSGATTNELAAANTLVRQLRAQVADRLNFLQYLTVRRYLTMMFGALVVLLGVMALWR